MIVKLNSKLNFKTFLKCYIQVLKCEMWNIIQLMFFKNYYMIKYKIYDKLKIYEPFNSNASATNFIS